MEKRVLSYGEFKNKINESLIEESSIGDAVTGAIKKVKDFLEGTGSFFLNLILYKQKGLLVDKKGKPRVTTPDAASNSS